MPALKFSITNINKMRKSNILFAMFLAVFAVVFSACHKDDDKDEVVPVYSYGITKVDYTSVSTSSNPAATSGTDEMSTITNAYADAFKTALNVSGTMFSYNGGDDKVLAACRQAEDALKDKTFKGKYTLEVNKLDGATKVIYTWNSPEPVTPEPEPVNPDPEPKELPEYTILFYGHGGGNLDMPILDNVNQFFYAKPESFKKVNIAVQYKFSTAESYLTKYGESEDVGELCEGLGMSEEELAETISLKTMRFGFDGGDDLDCDEENYNWTYPLWSGVIPDDEIYLDDENIDFGDPANLVDFIKWGVENYPAKKYILLLSDHGGGYSPHDDTPARTLSKGLIYDDGHPDNSVCGKSHLTVTEVTDAIAASGIKPEIIYMDACLMNTAECQFELKDAANYLILSTFCVPGEGGYYTSLVNELAENNNIEAALTNFCQTSMKRWDYNGWKYSDMSVIRTSGLDAFGVLWADFTDRLVGAYICGDDDVKAKIDKVTGYYTLRVSNGSSSYVMTTYGANLADVIPEYIPESLTTQLEDAYDACIVESVASKILADNGWQISCSVMLGAQGHYTVYEDVKIDVLKNALGSDVVLNEDYIVGDNNYLYLYYRFNPDGTGVGHYTISDREEAFNWGGTFEDTYKSLKWDQATGWSHWIEINEQEPVEFSPISFEFNFADDSFTPTK